MSWRKQTKVPMTTYETAVKERNAFEEEVKRLQQQVAVLVINEDVMRRLALHAIALLGKVSTTHRASITFKREIDAFLAEASSAGLFDEEGTGYVEKNTAISQETPGQARTETYH